jgi:hypothetical protein
MVKFAHHCGEELDIDRIVIDEEDMVGFAL